jgi:hypothetical protein
VRRESQQIWEIMALVAGFGLFCTVVVYLLLTTALSLHAKIVLASSIFYISPVEQDLMKNKSNADRTKFEFESRLWFPSPKLYQWTFRLCCWRKAFATVGEAADKL